MRLARWIPAFAGMTSGLALHVAKDQFRTMYSVKEIYYTLQGEGAQTGRPAVFCRFAGCNLWSGREDDRDGAVCDFCDTDFVGTDGPSGGKLADAAALASACRSAWRGNSGTPPFIVLTGGEPMLQLDEALIDALHEKCPAPWIYHVAWSSGPPSVQTALVGPPTSRSNDRDDSPR